MKESPILFTKQMVAAILAGNKTQTRRLVKDIAIQWLNSGLSVGFVADADNYLSRFGYENDWLWVREKFQVERVLNDFIITYSTGEKKTVYYKSLSLHALKILDRLRVNNPGKCIPNIFMPKEISRIWLQLTAVRIEYLKDITEADALAEGVEFESGYNCYLCDTKGHVGGNLLCENGFYQSPVEAYLSLWDSINNIQALANPYVWVYTFKVISTTGKPQQA